MVTSRANPVSPRLQQIAKLARNAPQMVFTTLAHHIDHDLLLEAYQQTRKNGAPGIDGQTATDYAVNLKGNLGNLLNRFKSGTYKAPPVRRVHIPKGDGGKTRPIGIPTFEDKLLQRAVTMVLEAVYEQDFLSCSYGFRPGRSAHQALQALWDGLMKMGGGWVLDVDLQNFFGSLEHGHLRSFLDQRMRDGVIRRAIGKWLNAGALEGVTWTRSESGSPQGGVISPLLSNIYLHEVLDTWFEQEVKPRLSGSAFLIRYADDFVIVCALERDARRVMEVLPKRLGRFGLTVHPEKTRLIPFSRPPHGGSKEKASFDLLGFTHFWGRSRKGWWVVKRKTSKGRFSRTIKRVAAWCRANRHRPIAEQHRRLSQMLQGYDAYFGITGNSRALQSLRLPISEAWRFWLDRRSSNSSMDWDKFNRLLKRYPLPGARVVHSVFQGP
jgi:RNA-directed DNA polymerase